MGSPVIAGERIVSGTRFLMAGRFVTDSTVECDRIGMRTDEQKAGELTEFSR